MILWSLDARYFPLDLPLRVAIALAVLSLVGLWAWWKRQLTASGLVMALAMGLATTLIGGFTSLSLYLFFLISAALIGRLSRRIRGLERIHRKGGRRDWMQVLANGGAALVAIVIHHFEPGPLPLAVFCACLGEACSDTWASEIGVLSSRDPVSILTFTRVPRGLSGGVSLLGTGAALLSSVLYAMFAFSCYRGIAFPLALLVCLSSFVGVMVDSLLGATIQAHYYDEKDDLFTEHSHDREGNALKLARGIRFMDNDMVNLTSNVVTFLLCWSLGSLMV